MGFGCRGRFPYLPAVGRGVTVVVVGEEQYPVDVIRHYDERVCLYGGIVGRQLGPYGRDHGAGGCQAHGVIPDLAEVTDPPVGADGDEVSAGSGIVEVAEAHC